ncbi:amino acid adenylation domain protein [Richelia sinica FACHB-800]|uniref:Amino acid adenylation domain protein n=1 Tax=Richelia sinica FACHB-800 TaxID=1357546 RepID=A0A975T9W8_9NOST|nr:non-ribosomal peptide synthetase [Richelia sinica]MBD2665598.1 amino acid adenylation domain-containing protein [Richelia sinica FACHB-800]QXE24832.1 amino acid adenylation domain protein [Richelia sinica FACHB-800]
MKTIQEFLSDLCSQDIKIWAEGDRLRCSGPKAVLTPEIKAELAARKLEILAFISQGNQALQATSPSIQPAGRDGNIPLSFAQQRLWFLSQLETNSSAYNIPAVVRLTGQLNINALSQSCQEIIRRHEILRTNFIVADGSPIQVIGKDNKFIFPVIDLQILADNDKQREVQNLAILEAQKPFDLEKDALLRATVLQLSSTEYVVLLTMHHIVSDGWSIGILIKELTALYTAFSQGEPSPLPELPIQYADFAIWQRQWLQGDVLQTQLNYWQQILAGELPILELPTDYSRPAIQSNNGATKHFQLSKSLTEKLKDLSQQEGVTLFMTLLAAFKVLLYRYTQQKDIIVGTPIANRNRAEIEGLIGFFVNTLVLRTNLDHNPSFRELLQQVKQVTLGAYAHQDLPFETLVETIQPGRDLSHSPLFQVMFVLQNTPAEDIELPELNLEILKAEKHTTKFDLTLSLTETEVGLKGDLEYNTDIFNADRITRMIGHFQVLLEGIVNNPQQHLSELPLLTTSEQHQLLIEWNNTETDYPQNQCIHQLFEAQVEKTPDAVAVVFENEQLTYWELNAKANQLAQYLQKLGVGPEVLVGICVKRSLEMIIGLLAILKAGGVYLPLDPNYPTQRLAFMLEDAQIKILLTQAQLLEILPFHQAKVICIDKDWEIISQENRNNLKNQVSPTNNAYTLYTSGSTGKPKAVVIEHRNTLALLNWARQVFTSQDLTGVLASTSICFDLSVFELFLPLSWGGKVILIENILHLPSFPTAKEVTFINTVPSAIAELLKIDGIPASVHTINLAGEALSLKLVQQLYQKTSAKNVFNLYGPSEDTTYSTFSLVKVEAELVTIGRPISNTQAYILDAHLQPVPIGIPGELYIDGAGLARCYLNRPELTAEKFIPNPFSKKVGARLYKTGDLVRYLLDGNIEFIGRIDHQIKIRGFRIEIGEIEAAIHQHPEVREAVVLVRGDIADDKRLVAYIVTYFCEISVRELRDFLKAKLPEYMIPSAFVVLEKFPLTPNGKIDRRILPAPDTIQNSEENSSLALTPVQELLSGIWAAILGIKQVGIHDNFFELGGHSLLATRVISQIRKAFKIDLQLRCLFASPTIKELAKEIENTKKADCKIKLPHIGQTSRIGNIPISYAQQRLWYLHQLESNNTAYNICNAVRIIGSLNIPALEHSLNGIIGRHEIIRTNFMLEQGQPIQVVSPCLKLKLPIIDLSQLLDDEKETTVQKLVHQEAERLFNLDTDPLLRVTLLQLSETEYVLLFTMHHIISDGWSMGVLINEIVALYEAYSRGKPSPLPEILIQYADFAIWQHQWLQGEVLEELLSYWQQQLQNLPTLKLPTDYPRPLTPTYQGSAQPFTLSPTLSQQIKTLSDQHGVTLFMTLQAAFATLVHYYSEQDDIVIGTDVANRNQGETEGLIGFFVNQLVLRTKFDGNPSFSELLERVRAVTLDAYAHQDLPFDKLVEAINPDRNLHSTPLFQVKLILQNTHTTTLKIPGLTFQELTTETKTATFDLLFDIRDTEQGLTGLLKYSTDLFTAKTIASILKHFETILSQIVSQPTVKINEITEILAQADKQEKLAQEINYQNSLQQKLGNIRRRSVK